MAATIQHFTTAAGEEEAAGPKDAHLWLTPEQQQEWVAIKSQVSALIFASFVAFNVISRFSLRILNRKGAIKDPSNQALLQYGAAAATHAVISVMAAFFILVRRDVSHCGSQAFCHDDLSARLWTMHAGYSLYEFLFWQNNGGLVKPWNEMLLLHNVVTLLMAVSSLMYPARLSLSLLPCHQLLHLATLVDCVRRFTSIYGAAWHLRFKVYMAFIAAFAAKAVGAAAMAAYAWYWLRGHSLWTLDLPEGMSAFNVVYGMVWLAGSVVQAMIFVKWMGAAVTMTSALVDQIQGKGGQAAAAQAKDKGGKLANGNRKKERQRR